MKKRKILIACIAAVIALCAVLFWAYRHPGYSYEKDGTLKAIPTICVVKTFLGMPVPEDIALNWHEWGETLVQQHYFYEEKYVSHDVSYSTTVRNGETAVEFTGTGTADNNVQEQIHDTVTLPFELYGVN